MSEVIDSQFRDLIQTLDNALKLDLGPDAINEIQEVRDQLQAALERIQVIDRIANLGIHLDQQVDPAEWIQPDAKDEKIYSDEEIRKHEKNWKLLDTLRRNGFAVKEFCVYSNQQEKLANLIANQYEILWRLLGSIQYLNSNRGQKDSLQIKWPKRNYKQRKQRKDTILRFGQLSGMVDVNSLQSWFKGDRKRVDCPEWNIPLDLDGGNGMKNLVLGKWLDCFAGTIVRRRFEDNQVPYEAFSNVKINYPPGYPIKFRSFELDLMALTSKDNSPHLILVECKSGKIGRIDDKFPQIVKDMTKTFEDLGIDSDLTVDAFYVVPIPYAKAEKQARDELTAECEKNNIQLLDTSKLHSAITRQYVA